MKRNVLIIVLAMAMLLGCAIAGACGGGQNDGGQLPSGAAVTGTVEQVAGDAMTISTAQGMVTVIVGEGTSIEKMGEGTLADISPGEDLTVRGEQKEDGSIDATQIFVISGFMFGSDQPEGAGQGLQRPGRSGDGTPPADFEDRTPPGDFEGDFEDEPSAGGMTRGTVMTVEGNVVTLETRDSTTTSVVISDSTSIQKTVEGGLDDISPGQNVSVWGTQKGDGPIEALGISIIDTARFMRQ